MLSRSQDACVRTSAASWFEPGRNCWRIAATDRAGVLIDADAYFRAVAEAIARARQSVLILSWDIDSRIGLSGGRVADHSHRLGGMLHAALHRQPALEVHVLNWDFALMYALERELLPQYRRDWRTHPRLHFHLDGTHPLGACHHQKVVVVDDAVAFVGGLDMCDRRWDTPAHEPDDARRIDLGGQPYGPFHDVQMIVDAKAARALGELARERWRAATGEILRAPQVDSDPWPASVTPDLTDVEIAIARTTPPSDTTPAVLEVEALFLDAIRAARQWLYVENQYLTSDCIGDALAARLAERDGPEVVLIVPREGAGWLEEQTMSMRRKRIVARIRASDTFGRLRVYTPMLDDSVMVNVHSKVMIVDDVHLRVGSANLSNRSMRVDTECDLAITATDGRTEEAIARVRHRLLADHLGVTPAVIAAAMAETGSLIRAIESVRGRHTLSPLGATPAGWLESLPPAAHVFDPVEPIDAAHLLGELLPVPRAVQRRSWLHVAVGALCFVVGFTLGRWIGEATRDDPHHG